MSRIIQSEQISRLVPTSGSGKKISFYSPELLVFETYWASVIPPPNKSAAQKQETVLFWFIIIPYAEKNNINWWPLSHINLLYHTSHHDINDNNKQILVEWCSLADSHYTFLLTHSRPLFPPSIQTYIRQTYLNLPGSWGLEREMQI